MPEANESWRNCFYTAIFHPADLRWLSGCPGELWWAIKIEESLRPRLSTDHSTVPAEHLRVSSWRDEFSETLNGLNRKGDLWPGQGRDLICRGKSTKSEMFRYTSELDDRFHCRNGNPIYITLFRSSSIDVEDVRMAICLVGPDVTFGRQWSWNLTWHINLDFIWMPFRSTICMQSRLEENYASVCRQSRPFNAFQAYHYEFLRSRHNIYSITRNLLAHEL